MGDFALFDTSPLTQFSKLNKFLWVCWFLDKNLSNFVPPVWKLDNPYCHSLRQWVWLFIVICPQGGFFLIIRFPNLESSAWGTKFSSGPVEQTGIVGICLHLLLEDKPIPLMGGRLYPPQSLDPIDLTMFRRAFTCDGPTDRFSQVRLASISRLVELQI